MRTLLILCAALAPLLVAGQGCPDGFDDLGLGGSRCYSYSTEKKAWNYALTSCPSSADGAQLLSVPEATDFYPQYFQVRNYSLDFWTGLLNFGGTRSWADGTVYVDSLDEFVADDAGDEMYGYLAGEDGLFRFDDFNTERGYICYVDVSAEASTTPAPEECPTDWESYEDTCYLFSTKQEYWSTAGHACHGLGAELISIHDVGLLTFLVLTANPSSTAFWIGLENQNQTYVWEDGTSADTIEDLIPYMDDWTEGKDCVALIAEDFPQPLKHRNCLTKQNYICYKAAYTSDLDDVEFSQLW